MVQIKLNPQDVAEVKETLARLGDDDAKKAMARGINKTMEGVRTDGTKIIRDKYVLTASEIRKSWKIRKALFRDPTGVVGSTGTFIRLMGYGAKQVQAGVSVKVLRKEPRKIVKHAFIAKLGNTKQVYRRKYRDKAWGRAAKSDIEQAMGKAGWALNRVTGRYFPVAAMPREYRFPIKALYGPRVQDYLGDPVTIGTLTRLAGERLTKNMKHEVEYLLGQAKSL